MEYENKLPEWATEGESGEPSEDLKKSGFKPGYKPPANIFNWFWSLVSKAITELQNKLTNVDLDVSYHRSRKDNPHEVTAEQVGAYDKDTINMLFYNSNERVKNVETSVENHYSNVENPHFVTAHQTGAYTKVEVDAKTTEINEAVQLLEETKVDVNLTNVNDEVFRTKVINTGGVNTPIVEATSTDGITYTATVNGVTKLTDGMEIIIIPNISNVYVEGATHVTVPNLNVNNLGAIDIRRPLSSNTFSTNPMENNFMRQNTPCRLMYHASYGNKGVWLIAEKQKTSAQDLYGTVPLKSGGTSVPNENTEGAFYAQNDENDVLKGHYGVLPVEFGGTGAKTETELKSLLVSYGFPKIEFGDYVGDGGTTSKTLTFNGSPVWVMIIGDRDIHFAMPNATIMEGAVGAQNAAYYRANLSFGTRSITLTAQSDYTDLQKASSIANTKDAPYHWMALLK